MKIFHWAWNRDYLFLLLVVLSLQWRGAVRQSSSLFYNLRILNIIIIVYNRSLRTTACKLKPVYQFGKRINQTTDTDNDKCSIAHTRRIKQSNDTCKKNQNRNQIKCSGTGIQRRAADREAICCTPPIIRINPNKNIRTSAKTQASQSTKVRITSYRFLQSGNVERLHLPPFSVRNNQKD